MSLSQDDVRKLALLARLDLSDDEIGTLGPQLQRILTFVEQLSELETEEVEPMTTALEVENRWAADRPGVSLTREEALAAAPQRDDECFLVPPVLFPNG